jgi:hypothetical protein
MSHFAKVLIQPVSIIVDGKPKQISGGIVVNGIVAEQEFFDTFVDTSPGTWIQTSYNTYGGLHLDPETRQPDGGIALRGNYATIGGIYDSTNDVFYSQQPYPSWTISAPTWTWQPPVPYPTDVQNYYWDEETLSWKTYDI